MTDLSGFSDSLISAVDSQSGRTSSTQYTPSLFWNLFALQMDVFVNLEVSTFSVVPGISLYSIWLIVSLAVRVADVGGWGRGNTERKRLNHCDYTFT